MYKIIQGGVAEDHRGSIRFVNDFNMSNIKRFYIIKNKTVDLIRGWRGHKIEQRWFYVIEGEFLVRIVKIDNWDSPDRNSLINTITLNAKEEKLLHIPAGYATAFQSNFDNSEMLVFADFGLDHASQDDYTFDLEYFGK